MYLCAYIFTYALMCQGASIVRYLFASFTAVSEQNTAPCSCVVGLVKGLG